MLSYTQFTTAILVAVLSSSDSMQLHTPENFENSFLEKTLNDYYVYCNEDNNHQYTENILSILKIFIEMHGSNQNYKEKIYTFLDLNQESIIQMFLSCDI